MLGILVAALVGVPNAGVAPPATSLAVRVTTREGLVAAFPQEIAAGQ